MSTPEITLISIVKDKISNTIHPQILQLVNIYLIQYINTGDRVKDGCYTIIINALIALILSSVYYGLIEVYNMISSKFISTDNEINVEQVLKTHTTDVVSKYKHRVNIGDTSFSMICILDYIKEKKILDNFNCKENTNYTPYLSTDNKIVISISRNHIKNPFIPIHRYINKHTNKYEYVFIYDYEFVSQSFEELKNIVEQITIYNFECNNKKNQTLLMISELDCTSKSVETVVKGAVSEHITFDKIHFEEKEILLSWINKFNSNKLYPPGLCMSNKLGILLYGPPGTGKTGCISALANLLKRNIIMINSLNLCGKSKNDLDDLIRNRKKYSIFVFDEFDYLLTSDDKKSKKSEKVNYQEMLLYADGDERKKILENIQEQRTMSDNQIDQAYILKLLDGVGDNDGRIIIATTNNPEKINKVFLRPGRFDLKLKLGFCTLDMFKNIVKTKFNEPIDNYLEQVENILKKNITPLILINTIIGSSTFEELLINLEKMEQQEYHNCLQK